MIKFESIIKTKNDSISSNGIIFSLNKNQINFVYSENSKDLIDAFNIITGFYNPHIGSIIYDEYNLLNFSLNEKSSFIKNNVSILTCFSNEELDLTIYEYFKLQINCLSLKQAKIDEIFLQFDFKNYLNKKISELDNKKIIELLVATAILNNPKYILTIHLEKYLFSKESFKYFFNLLKKYFDLSNIVFAFFTNQKIFCEEKKIDLKFNFINIDDSNKVNDTFIIRTNKYEFKKVKLGTKSFFNLFNHICKSNALYMIFVMVINIIFSITLFLFSFLNNNKINNNLVISLFIIFSLLNFIYSCLYPFFFFKKIKNWIYIFSRKGINYVNIIQILLLVIFIIEIFYFAPSIVLSIISIYVLKIQIDWILKLLTLLVPILISIVSMLFSYVYFNKRMFKKQEEII